MRLLARIAAQSRALLRRGRMERDMESEHDFHVAARAADLERGGLPRAEAEARARAEFGDLLRWREDCREARGVRLADELRADVRYGLRWLRRSPGFAAAAIVSLGLGIGANTAVFSLLDAVLLKSLPVAQPEALVVLSHRTGGAPAGIRSDGARPSAGAATGTPADAEVGYAFSYRMFRGFAAPNGALVDALASAGFTAHVEIDGAPTPVARGQLVSGNYYDLLGVPAALGRVIQPADDRHSGAGAVAVLSHAYWQRQFGGDPRVLGRVVRLNGHPFTIIGVSPPEFFGTRVGERPDVTVPLTMQRQAMPTVGASWIDGDGGYQFWLEVIGRLKPGVSLSAAEAALAGGFRQQVADFVVQAGPKGRRFASAQLQLEPGSRGLSELRRRFSRPLAVVMAVVALVLLIACANLANLLLARAAARRREMAVRVSLGASRGRLVRQLLTESLVLALAGGTAGVVVAWWAGEALASALIGDGGPAIDVGLDRRVLGFTSGISLLTAMLFGLVPAIGASRVEPHAALTQGRDPGVARGRAGVGRLLVSGQVAASLLLLVGAGLFVRTLINLQQADSGFTRETVLVTRLEPRGSNQKWENSGRLLLMYDDLLARVRALPGVRAASLSGSTPVGDEQPLEERMTVAGYVPNPGEDLSVRWLQIYPQYFSTVGVPLLAGRDLTAADNDRKAPNVVVVNETLARRVFGSPAAAIGRSMHRASDVIRAARITMPPFTIVGVAADVHDRDLRAPIVPMAYASFAQTPTGRGQMTLVVRAAGDASAMVPMIRDQVRRLDDAMPLRAIETIAQRLDESLRQERLVAALSSGFGLLALLLSCVGLYGVMAYGVTRRRAEFGLRMALGARRGDVSWLVLRETLTLVALGLAIGLPLALVASRLIARMLFGLTPTDPITLTSAVLLLAIVATIAGYLPARRASRVDPLVALRHE